MQPGSVLVVHYLVEKIKCVHLHILLGFKECLCLPKAELNTKNETKRPLFNGRLVSFLVFNSITHVGKKVTRLTTKWGYWIKW